MSSADRSVTIRTVKQITQCYRNTVSLMGCVIYKRYGNNNCYMMLPSLRKIYGATGGIIIIIIISPKTTYRKENG